MAGICAVVVAVITIFMTAEVVALRGETDEAEATVVGISHGWRSFSSIDVDFVTASGERIEASTIHFDASPKPEVGDRIRIRHLPDDPYVLAQVGSIPDYLLPSMFGAMVLLFAAYAVDLILPWIPAWLRDR